MNIGIKEALQQRFGATPPEDHQRRIIFWQDPDGEFADLVDELCLDGVKILKLTGTNNFAAKLLLSKEDLESNFLVYNPISYADIKDDWLLDIELYSEEFRADLISMRMQELGVSDTPALRKAMRSYAKFFENKVRVARLSSYENNYHSVGQLHVDILSVLSGAASNSPQGILRAILMGNLALDENEAISNIRKFGNETVLWELINRYTGFVHGDGEESLLPLASHVLLTALTVTMNPANMKGLEKHISEPHQQTCYSFIHEWLHSEDDDALYELAREVEELHGLVSRFDNLDVADLLSSECFPCINECILRHFMTEISENVVKADDIVAAVEQRRTRKWYKRVQYYFDGLLQAARMQQFYQTHIDGFHIAEYAELWKEYCNDYCKMDHFYRLFHAAFGKSLKESSTVLEDLYKNVADHVERLYKNWFLGSLGAQWTSLVRDEMEKGAGLPSIPQQAQFYKDYVTPIFSNGSRAFVIVSDALRYEVGVDLTGQLIRETKGTAKISAVQAVFPTVTKFGMAALLPHDELALTDGLSALCDGLSTEGTESRQKVLQTAHTGNVAITYKALLAMKLAERRELISDAQVVYIYHNTIDAVGDKATTEDQVFEACEDAILELKNLIRLIVNDMNGTNIIVTSDHGFLYSYQPLDESDKLEKTKLDGDILELERRYAISNADAAAEHMVKIPLKHLGSDLYGFAPLDAIRLKKAGGGMNYVHGGISLQEMVVPVVEYKNIRATSKKYVDAKNATLQLVSQSRKVSNSIFSLDFYQPEPVGGKISAATYEVFMTDSKGALVSDRAKIIADKTSTNGADRMFRIRLTLKSVEFKKEDTYYLTVVEAGSTNPIDQAEFSIDIAFVNDFDF